MLGPLVLDLSEHLSAHSPSMILFHILFFPHLALIHLSLSALFPPHPLVTLLFWNKADTGPTGVVTGCGSGAHTSLPDQTLSTRPPRCMQESARPGAPLASWGTASLALGSGRPGFPTGRDQHGLWSRFQTKEKREESFRQHLLSSFSYLIKALVSLSDPSFLALLVFLLGYSRAPAPAIVSFP